jgi:hypothetical protein
MRKDQAELIKEAERLRRYAKEADRPVPPECIVSPQSYEFEEWAELIESFARRPETDQAEAPKAAKYGSSDPRDDAAEAYMSGEWTPDDAPVPAQAVVTDADVAALWDRLVSGGWTPPMRPSDTLFKILRDGVVRALSPHNPTGE